MALALVVFVVFNVEGIRRNGVGYFKHMAGPVWYLAWLIFPIEIVGLLVRPASLSLRLAGNMTGDHMVFKDYERPDCRGATCHFLGLGYLRELPAGVRIHPFVSHLHLPVCGRSRT